MKRLHTVGGYDSFILLDSLGAKANDIMIYRYITDQKKLAFCFFRKNNV